jgi:hypothetical protein
MLERWNDNVDAGVLEIGWRKDYQIHVFVYNSLMTIMFQSV